MIILSMYFGTVGRKEARKVDTDKIEGRKEEWNDN